LIFNFINFEGGPEQNEKLLMNLIIQNIEDINMLCRQHQVEQLFIFGSIKTDKFNDDSDIDILLQFSHQIDPAEYFENYMDFKEKMESLLNREVDIVENQAVRNPIFRKILDREKILVYERKSA
jgi:predicted nucleotidyltransferase